MFFEIFTTVNFSDPQIGANRTHILQIGSYGRFALHVIDNLVIVHHQMNKVSSVFDIKSEGRFDGYTKIVQPLFNPECISKNSAVVSKWTAFEMCKLFKNFKTY